MRFCNLVFASFAGALLAPFGRTMASEAFDAAPKEIAGAPKEEAGRFVASKLEAHQAPAVWTYELDEDVVETPELVAMIREAFILAANEAHDMTNFEFDKVFIKEVMHEPIDLDYDDAMMQGDTEDEGDLDDDDNEWTITSSFQSLVASLGRSKKNRFKRKYRTKMTTAVSFGCRLCGKNGKDDDSFMSSTIDAMDAEFYQSNNGVAVLKRWQKGFCGKLRRVKQLKKPSRCFIFFDLDHLDDPVDQPSLMLSISEN